MESSDSESELGVVDLSSFHAVMHAAVSDGTHKIYNNRIKRLRDGLNSSMDLSDPRAAHSLMKVIENESKHENGCWKTPSTPESFRSALIAYCKQRHSETPAWVNNELSLFIKGLRSIYASGRRDGTFKGTEGKDVLEFDVFCHLCRATIADSYSDGHLFLLLCWNMTCRSDTAHHLGWHCLRWGGDCMQVVIPKSKSMQQGAMRGPTHQFNVYSNPLQPELCIFLSLGIKIVTTGMYQESIYRPSEPKLYADWLDRNLQALSHGDYTPDFGTQSVRKGSLTYTTNFSGAASAISAILRAGYTLGGVLPKYIKLSIDGDQSVGRTLSGLPVNSPDFSLLPARFQPNVSINMGNIVHDLSAYPANFLPCVPFCIAALVYHRNWLRQNLPRTHPLFNSRFWRINHHNSLAAHVLPPVRMECKVTNMRATGISPMHVVLHTVQTSTDNAAPPPHSTATTSADPRLDTISTAIVQMGQAITTLTQTVRASIGTTSGLTTSASTVTTPLSPPVLNQASTEFKWPKQLTLREVHEHWYVGDIVNHTPPLRHIRSKFVAGADRRYITYARGCVDAIDAHLPGNFLQRTPEQRDGLFRTACGALVQQMRDAGHTAATSTLSGRVMRLNYASLYSNELHVLRKTVK